MLWVHYLTEVLLMSTHNINFHGEKKKNIHTVNQGSGNFEIWIGDDDVINEPISKKKKYVYITLSRKLMTIGSPITPFK